jgi:Tfp pilus assembly protein PilF
MKLQGGSDMMKSVTPRGVEHLNLVDHLLAMGRKYQELGRHRDALNLFTRLAGFRELPAEAAEETQARLAELQLKRRKYGRARRHLTAALRHQPASARYHHQMATALQAEDRGNLEQAAEHYRRALELEPGFVKCLTDYGLLAVRLGRVDEGLARLREAVERAPEDAEAVGKLVKGLRLTGRGDEARTALRAALFRNPRSPRFRKLWSEFQFQQLRQQREAERLERESALPSDEGPVLLPFTRPAGGRPAEGATPTILRREAGVLPPHRPRRRPDQRNVQ